MRNAEFRGAGVRWTPLPQAEAPTEPTGETALTRSELYDNAGAKTDKYNQKSFSIEKLINGIGLLNKILYIYILCDTIILYLL